MIAFRAFVEKFQKILPRLLLPKQNQLVTAGSSKRKKAHGGKLQVSYTVDFFFRGLILSVGLKMGLNKTDWKEEGRVVGRREEAISLFID